MSNLYDILGIGKKAIQEEIKSAYRKKAKKAHPDKPGGNSDEMKEIVRAYDVLKNPSRRDRYDKTGQEEQDPFDLRFQAICNQIFVKLIDSNENMERKDLIADFKTIIGMNRDQAKKEKRKQEKRIVKFRKAIDRLKSSDNRIGQTLKLNVSDMELKVSLYEEDIKFFGECSDVVDKYQWEVDPEPEPEENAPNWFTNRNGNYFGGIDPYK